MIKAIETRYKGYRFRSRLEARWAVFFDTLGIEYKYEPEGFECNGNCYLPDFYLVKSETWVEVKGSDELLKEDESLLESMLDYSSPIPGIENSGYKRTYGMKANGLVILGEIPFNPNFGVFLHRIIRHHKGLCFDWAMFLPGMIEVFWCDRLISLFGGDNDFTDWTTKSLFIPTTRHYPAVTEAYKAARSARFEHGETPR